MTFSFDKGEGGEELQYNLSVLERTVAPRTASLPLLLYKCLRHCSTIGK